MLTALFRLVCFQRCVAEEALDEEQAANADQGCEPERGEADDQGERAGDACREVRHGDELAVETSLDRPYAPWQQADDAEQRARGEDEDYEEERLVHAEPDSAEVDARALQAPGQEGDGRSYKERDRRQQRVRGAMEVAEMRGEAVNHRQLLEHA